MGITTVYLIRHSEKLKIDGEYKTNENEQIKNEKIILSIDGERKAQEQLPAGRTALRQPDSDPAYRRDQEPLSRLGMRM